MLQQQIIYNNLRQQNMLVVYSYVIACLVKNLSNNEEKQLELNVFSLIFEHNKQIYNNCKNMQKYTSGVKIMRDHDTIIQCNMMFRCQRKRIQTKNETFITLPLVDTFVKAHIRFNSLIVAASRRGQLQFAFSTAFSFDSLHELIIKNIILLYVKGCFIEN